MVDILKIIDDYLNNEDEDHQKEKSSKQSDSLSMLIKVLNEEDSTKAVLEKLHISELELSTLIKTHNLYYHSFLDYWSEMSEESIVRDLVSKINMGLTIYDLTKVYSSRRTKREQIASGMQLKLMAYGYKYDQAAKKWFISEKVVEPKADSPETEKQKVKAGNTVNDKLEDPEALATMVNELKSMNKVAVKLNVTTMEIRNVLKENNYRYDSYFDMWTNRKRKDLLEELANMIDTGQLRYTQLSQIYGIDPTTINTKLREHGIEIPGLKPKKKEPVEDKAAVPARPAEKYVETSKETVSSHPVEKTEEKQENIPEVPFTDEEVKVLKNWALRLSAEEKGSSMKKKATVFLDGDIFVQLDETSEKQGTSRSRIIERALIDYFKTLDK